MEKDCLLLIGSCLPKQNKDWCMPAVQIIWSGDAWKDSMLQCWLMDRRCVSFQTPFFYRDMVDLLQMHIYSFRVYIHTNKIDCFPGLII